MRQQLSIALVLVFCVSAASAAESDRTKLPQPPSDLEGKIGKTFADSYQSNPQPDEPPKSAANIVLIHEDNFVGRERYAIASETALRDGNVEVAMDHAQKPAEKNNPSIGGSVTLSVNGRKVAEGEVENVVPSRLSTTATLDFGAELTTVSETYVARNAFVGKIKTLVIKLK